MDVVGVVVAWGPVGDGAHAGLTVAELLTELAVLTAAPVRVVPRHVEKEWPGTHCNNDFIS